jgi:hypothetical protein
MKILIRFAALLVLLLSTVVVGAPAYAQQVGCYLSFDGVDDRVDIASSSAFPLFEYSLSAWVKTTGTTGLQVILSRGEDSIIDVLPWGFGLLGTGVVYLQIENAADTTHAAYPGVTPVDDGSWHHVAATRTPDGTLKLYVDGLLDATHATPDTAASSQTVGMGVTYQDSGGAAVKPPVLFWNGSLDDLTVWSVALDDSAIADLAANGVPASPTGLVAHWELDEGMGQTAADSAAGGSHPGTLGGTTDVEASDPVWVCGAKIAGLLTAGIGCLNEPTPDCVSPTHILDSTNTGNGFIELDGPTLDFRVGIKSATFTPLGSDPLFEFSDVVYSGTATVDTVGSTHTITFGSALISGYVNVGEVVSPDPFTTSALDFSGSCEGAGSAVDCVLTFTLTDPAFDVVTESAFAVGGESRYFVHTVTALPEPGALLSLGSGLMLLGWLDRRRRRRGIGRRAAATSPVHNI